MDNKNEDLSPISIESVARYSVDESFDSERFIKMELLVMHDKKNFNRTSFDEKGMKAAKSSIYNIPILGYVTPDENGVYDFNGHNRHIETQKNNKKKIIYDEIPIGLVPESANYEIVELDNEKWVKTECYIWKGYSNYAEDVINEKKEIPLSMEIFADKYTIDKKSKYFDIFDYRYRAITFLGRKNKPAMGNSSGKTLDFSKETYDILTNMKELLSIELESYEKGGNAEMNMENIKDDEQETVVQEHSEETNASNDVEIKMNVENNSENVVETTKAECSIEYSTYRETHNVISSGISFLNKHSDELNIYYYLFDFDDKYVFLTKNTDKKVNGRWKYSQTIVRKTYSITDNTVAFGDQETEMVYKLVTVEESQEIEKQREETKKEFASLKEYKETKEKEIRVANEHKLFGQFDTLLKGNDKYNVLKDNAENYTIEELEEKCYSLAGRMSFTVEKSKEINNEKYVEHVAIDYGVEDEENFKSRSPYGQEVDKYY